MKTGVDEMKMKKVISAVVISLVCLSFVGCSDNPIQEDLLNYSNKELTKIVDVENEVIEGFDSVSGDNYTDDETMYYALQNEIIPASLELIEAAERITPSTKEVREIHEIYISSINHQHSAFIILLSALETQDYGQVNAANEKMDLARTESRDFLASLKELGKENDVEFDN